jgi:hypothetical protein
MVGRGNLVQGLLEVVEVQQQALALLPEAGQLIKHGHGLFRWGLGGRLGLVGELS